MRKSVLLASIALCACARTISNVSPPQTAAGLEPEIAAFEAADRANPPGTAGVLFVGSSSIRLWPDVANDFPGQHAINRGFGGSTLTDVVYFTPRVVLPYRPRLIVLYAGDNDLAAGHTPEQVASDYRAFATRVHRALPDTRIAFISIKPSPSRWSLADKMRQANAMVAADIARDPRATFVDVFTPMLGTNGRPRPELFVEDSLHMTSAGYALWRQIVARAVN
jgi:lysophospholipase L1-like esterase